MKLVYYFDHNGYYQGSGPANLDPLESDRWLLPASSTFTAPNVDLQDHEIAKWDGFQWTAVIDPFYQAELDRRAQVAIQQAELEAIQLQQSRLEEYTAFQSKLHFAIYDKTDAGDNAVLDVVGAYVLRQDVDSVPTYNGVELDDEQNTQYGYLPLNTNDHTILNSFRNKYNIFVKKVVNDVLLDRDAELVKTLSAPAALAAFRAERDARLYACDWTMLPDAPVSEELKTQLLTYRQALRDLPANTPDPENPTWPTNPLA